MTPAKRVEVRVWPTMVITSSPTPLRSAWEVLANVDAYVGGPPIGQAMSSASELCTRTYSVGSPASAQPMVPPLRLRTFR
jgi:hypothetical protein